MQVKMEVGKLKQYLRRLCLLISRLELPPNKTIESSEEAEQKVREIINTNLDISREDLNHALDKVHRLHLIKSYQMKKSSTLALKYQIKI